jgi:threonine dehydrogenase-like Zn-dependent dehydrogenase
VEAGTTGPAPGTGVRALSSGVLAGALAKLLPPSQRHGAASATIEPTTCTGATATIKSAAGQAAEAVMRPTDGRGVGAAMEAVGAPITLALCGPIVATGGAPAHIGVHGVRADLRMGPEPIGPPGARRPLDAGVNP